jgi:hypothetical protein
MAVAAALIVLIWVSEPGEPDELEKPGESGGPDEPGEPGRA